MLKDHARLMFIGFGPHSKSVYLPAIQKLSKRYPVSLDVVVEIESKVPETKEYFKQKTNLEPLVIGVAPDPGAPKLSTETSLLLNRIARENKINGVVIASQPQYLQPVLYPVNAALQSSDHPTNSLLQCRTIILLFFSTTLGFSFPLSVKFSQILFQKFMTFRGKLLAGFCLHPIFKQ